MNKYMVYYNIIDFKDDIGYEVELTDNEVKQFINIGRVVLGPIDTITITNDKRYDKRIK